MAYTAIVLTPQQSLFVSMMAHDAGLVPDGWALKCHHVTLCMGAKEGTAIGTPRKLRVTHYGRGKGVTAFRVSGAEDSVNEVPHVTIAVAPGHKPKESNEIAEWVPVAEPFDIHGTVEIRIA